LEDQEDGKITLIWILGTKGSSWRLCPVAGFSIFYAELLVSVVIVLVFI